MTLYYCFTRPVEGIASLLQMTADSLRHPDGHTSITLELISLEFLGKSVIYNNNYYYIIIINSMNEHMVIVQVH